MATYITIFLFEFISAYILWFVLKKALRITKFYRIAIICLAVSLVIGYIASYRIIGYEVTLDYLTKINNQKIKETGQGITSQEENEYKEELFQSREFRKLLMDSSIKISLIPFILVMVIMLFSVKRTIRNLPLEKTSKSPYFIRKI